MAADDPIIRIVVEDEAVLKEPAAGKPVEKEEKRAVESGSVQRGKKIKDSEGEDNRTLWQKLGQDLTENATDVIFSNLSRVIGSRYARTLTDHALSSITRSPTPQPAPAATAATSPPQPAQPTLPTGPAPQPATASSAAPTAVGSKPPILPTGAAPTATTQIVQATTTAPTAAPAAGAATGATAGAPAAAGPAAGAAVGGAVGGPAGAAVGLAAAVVIGDKLLQAVVQLAGYLYRTLNQMVENSKNYSPEVAEQAAASELRKINMELRRAEQIGPALARWERMVSVIATGVEDLKTRAVAGIAEHSKTTAFRLEMLATFGVLSEVARAAYSKYDAWLSEQGDNALQAGLDFFDKTLLEKDLDRPDVPKMPGGVF